MEKIAAVVVGAGVVGLAIARRLAMAGHETLILEQHGLIGNETSSRNSGVIHAGLYYEPHSLKARLCIQGKWALYDFAQSHKVNHAKCGKLIVATTEEQIPKLHELKARGDSNGMTDLAIISGADAKKLEPELDCLMALHSPSSGIIDQHELMDALLGDAENHGAVLALNSPLLSVDAAGDGFVLNVGGAAPMQLKCTILINAAGLHAQKLAHTIKGLAPQHIPAQILGKGHYFTCSGKAPFAHLIYPAPTNTGHGLHYMRDLGGQVRLGPDMQFVDTLNYDVPAALAEKFYHEVATYWPAVRERELRPDYSGIRPKLERSGSSTGRFVIAGHGVHGLRGLVNLFGIESPGLTSCLAIADEVLAHL